MDDPHLALAHRIAAGFAVLPQVQAVAMAGSRGERGGRDVVVDEHSDIDVYCYTHSEVPLADRRHIVEATGGAQKADMGLAFWGPGDEWIHEGSGNLVDVVYFDAAWMESQVERVTVQHQASLGYSTCFWHTVLSSVVLADPHGWLASLKARAAVPYSDELRRNIIELNRGVLRGVAPALEVQLGTAATRGDLVAVNHRLAALLASYFDVIFALNRVPHPGEKRLIQAAAACVRTPTDMTAHLVDILETSTSDLVGLSGRVERLLDQLDELLAAEGLTGDVG